MITNFQAGRIVIPNYRHIDKVSCKLEQDVLLMSKTSFCYAAQVALELAVHT